MEHPHKIEQLIPAVGWKAVIVHIYETVPVTYELSVRHVVARALTTYLDEPARQKIGGVVGWGFGNQVEYLADTDSLSHTDPCLGYLEPGQEFQPEAWAELALEVSQSVVRERQHQKQERLARVTPRRPSPWLDRLIDPQTATTQTPNGTLDCRETVRHFEQQQTEGHT